MDSKTTIAWTDSSVNPILARRADGKLGYHCVKVSAECAFCYSETFNERGLPNRGTGLPFVKASEGRVEIVLHRPALDEVLRWRRPRRIFWCSMTDLFGEFVPSDMVQECLDVAARAGAERGHVSQILTKRPERMHQEISLWRHRHRQPLPACVWPGFSAGDRGLFLSRWSAARELHRAGLVRGPIWCSYEPAIGPLVDPEAPGERERWVQAAADGLRWIVIGGESGGRARPFSLDWARDVLTFFPPGVRRFVKQVGARPYDLSGDELFADGSVPVGCWEDLESPKGENPEEWPPELRVREFPVVEGIGE